ALAEQATDRASAAIAQLQIPPTEHPWYDTWLDVQSPFDRDRLAERLTRATKNLNSLSDHLNRVFPHIVGRDDPSLNDARNIVRALRHIAAAPVGRIALNHPVWVSELAKIETAIAHGQRLSRLAHEFANQFRREAWTFDTTTLLLVLRGDGPSFFRRFSGRYR